MRARELQLNIARLRIKAPPTCPKDGGDGGIWTEVLLRGREQDPARQQPLPQDTRHEHPC